MTLHQKMESLAKAKYPNVLQLPRDTGLNEDEVAEKQQEAFVDGYETATTLAPVSVVGWVKTDNRNPNKSGYYFSYRDLTRTYKQVTYWYAETKEWSSTTSEWYDETTTIH
jgi:hypothetical protein